MPDIGDYLELLDKLHDVVLGAVECLGVPFEQFLALLPIDYGRLRFVDLLLEL